MAEPTSTRRTTWAGRCSFKRAQTATSIWRCYSWTAEPTVDLETPWHATPLKVAAAKGHFELAALCLSHGADVNAYTRQPQFAPQLTCHPGIVTWLDRILVAGSWARYLSAPRYALVVLRELVARGRARRRPQVFLGIKEQVLDWLFPGGHSRGRPRLPDDVFSVIARYYWGGGLSGGLSAEEEAVVARRAAAHEAEAAAAEDSANDY